jgi:hypothetical protein
VQGRRCLSSPWYKGDHKPCVSNSGHEKFILGIGGIPSMQVPALEHSRSVFVVSVKIAKMKGAF